MILNDLQQPLAEALQRMLERPESMHPFVVVNVVGTDHFVQFCGALERRLRFECPPLDTVAHFDFRGETLSYVAAEFARRFLRQKLDLPPDTELLINENPSPELAS